MADPLLEPWRWRQVEQLDGLGVICMDESPDGTFWFGCVGGIAHYDGYAVTSSLFDETLLQSIGSSDPQPWVKAVHVMKDGSVLASVEDSLLRHVNGRWEVVKNNLGKADNLVRFLAAEDGSIWLMRRNEVWRFDADLQHATRILQIQSASRIEDLCFDLRGHLWVAMVQRGEHAELVRIPIAEGKPAKKAAWEKYEMPFARESQEVRLLASRDGKLWYADKSANNGLFSFDPQNERWDSSPAKGIKETHGSLTQLKNGSIWAGGRGRIQVVREGRLTLYPRTDLDLSPMLIASIHEAQDGRLWIIERIGRVYVVDLDLKQWMTYYGIHYQCDSVTGEEWFISTSNHAVSHDPTTNSWFQYGEEDGLIDKPASITSSSHGLLWAVGSHEGNAAFSVFNGQRWKRYELADFAVQIAPDAIYEDRNHAIWIGADGAALSGATTGGALQYVVSESGDVQLKQHYSRASFTYHINSFAQTVDGDLWLGSPQTYKYNFETSTLAQISEVPLRYRSVMVMDQNECLWVAKKCLGVYRLDAGEWHCYTIADGLSSDRVFDLLPLGDGSVLALHEKGINRFDGQSWSPLLFSKLFSGGRNAWNLQSSSTGALWLNLLNEQPEGQQSDQMMRGRFISVRYVADDHRPDTQIDFYLDRVAQPGNSHISWSARDLWDNTTDNVLEFSWRLDQQAWSPFSAKTSKTFLDLPRGHHTLEVRARDHDFNIDPSPARVAFEVISPIWAQGWFIIMTTLGLSIVAASIWLVVHFRIKQLNDRQDLAKEREAHLIEMDQLKSSFFINVSHELRTPLTVIQGPLENLLRKEQDMDKKRNLSLMMRNVQRIATLINQLLDFRKLETGRIKIEATYGDLSQYIREMMASLKPLADLKEMTFQLEAPQSCFGWFDPDKLEKIVINLAANSIKYTPEGGSVVIKMDVLKNDPKGRRLMLMIEDTGPGIGKEHIHNIFERFYRLPESAMINGSGIGLNLIKELVDLWGGDITAESPIFTDEANPGSRFTVQLPIDSENLPHKKTDSQQRCAMVEYVKPPDELNAEQKEPLRSSRSDEVPLLLIVEDDLDLRTYVCSELNAEYRIEEAVNGAEGMGKAKALMPDLIVTDLMMPDVGGIELCKELKAHIETSHIPIIMLTAMSSLEHKVDGLESGADDYVTKPFQMILLASRIRNLIDSRRQLRERFRHETMTIEAALPGNSVDRAFLQNMFSMIEEHYSDPSFNPDSLATLVNMSKRTLHRKIKALTDATPMKLIYDVRLKKAAILLGQRGKSITEIAYEVGYEGYTQFFRQFKDRYDMSPRQYRADTQ